MPHQAVSDFQRNNSKRMRKAMTDAELKLWNAVRAHRLEGLGFKRQMPIGNYIVDFTCPEYRLIVELDGSQHADKENAKADAARTKYLECQGWQVIRFWNDDVLKDVDGVCQHILAFLRQQGVKFS